MSGIRKIICIIYKEICRICKEIRRICRKIHRICTKYAINMQLDTQNKNNPLFLYAEFALAEKYAKYAEKYK